MSTLRVDNIRGQTADGTNRYVVQVVQGTASTQTAHSSNAYADTGLSVTITPQLTTSKILIMANQKGVRLETDNGSGCSLALLRGSTIIYKPSPSTGHHDLLYSDGGGYGQLEITFLDSPSTTSATTYKTQCASFYDGRNVFCQQGNNFTSTIIAMEIAQ